MGILGGFVMGSGGGAGAGGGAGSGSGGGDGDYEYCWYNFSIPGNSWKAAL